jgi:hypothetical protein
LTFQWLDYHSIDVSVLETCFDAFPWQSVEMRMSGNGGLRKGPFQINVNPFWPSFIFTSYGILGATTFGKIKEFWNPITTLFKIASISGVDGIYAQIAAGDRLILGHFYILTFLSLTILCFVNMYMDLILHIISYERRRKKRRPPTMRDKTKTEFGSSAMMTREK